MKPRKYDLRSQKWPKRKLSWNYSWRRCCKTEFIINAVFYFDFTNLIGKSKRKSHCSSLILHSNLPKNGETFYEPSWDSLSYDLCKINRHHIKQNIWKTLYSLELYMPRSGDNHNLFLLAIYSWTENFGTFNLNNSLNSTLWLSPMLEVLLKEQTRTVWNAMKMYWSIQLPKGFNKSAVQGNLLKIHLPVLHSM